VHAPLEETSGPPCPMLAGPLAVRRSERKASLADQGCISRDVDGADDAGAAIGNDPTRATTERGHHGYHGR
jgi:hypothetical protein